MEASERDSTQDWLLPEDARPASVADLESRIDEALSTARASEAAAVTLGAAALDAAGQARRAAELAERASAAALDARDRAAGTSAPAQPEEEGLRSFSERADRLAGRLRQLQRLPLGSPAAAEPPPRSLR